MEQEFSWSRARVVAAGIEEQKSYWTMDAGKYENQAVHLEALQELALRISGERSVDAVLQSIVHGLAQQPDVALARVWVTEPGDVCGSCHMRAACPDHTACLHLLASAGTSLTGEQWSRTDGTFRRVPFGNSSMEFCPSPVRAIATDRTGQLLHVSACSQWAHPDWIQQETIESFAGHPLVFRGDTLGVLGVFRRALINEQEFSWLQMFANQAAAAVANARAFSELDRLRQQLESHNAYLKEEIDSALSFGRIVGRSRALRHVLRAGRRRGIVGCNGPDYRRVRHGQGAPRARDP